MISRGVYGCDAIGWRVLGWVSASQKTRQAQEEEEGPAASKVSHPACCLGNLGARLRIDLAQAVAA